jgi:NAD(P)-dependent dehydrogenase (short-subunit alcohol dehydrogenase family)
MPRVWLVGRGRRGVGRALSEAVLASGDRLVAVAAGVASPATARDAVAAAGAEVGRLDVVVSCAAAARLGSIEETPLDVLESQAAAALWGPLHVIRAALPVMRAQGAGRIVQVAGTDGRAPTWGLDGLLEELAAQVAPSGVRLTIVRPGGVRTAGRDDAPAGDHAPVVEALLGLTRDERPPARLTLGEDPPGGGAPRESALAGPIGACWLRCENYAR